MTLGAKIKLYRNLRGMTQKELGIAIGFTNLSAGVRIQKYEADIMAPKEEIRRKIADVLNIDIEALSDSEVCSPEDIMFFLFELEQRFGMEIAQADNRTVLAFPHTPEAIVKSSDECDWRKLLNYLTIWNSKKNSIFPSKVSRGEYQSWQARFVSNSSEYLDEKIRLIEECYKKEITKAGRRSDDEILNETTTDLVQLLVTMIDEGLSVKAESREISVGHGSQRFTFKGAQLLNAPSKKAKTMFGTFLADIKKYESLGVRCDTFVEVDPNEWRITYQIPIREFGPVTDYVNMYLDLLKGNKDPIFFEDNMRRWKLEMARPQFWNRVRDAIKDATT